MKMGTAGRLREGSRRSCFLAADANQEGLERGLGSTHNPFLWVKAYRGNERCETLTPWSTIAGIPRRLKTGYRNRAKIACVDKSGNVIAMVLRDPRNGWIHPVRLPRNAHHPQLLTNVLPANFRVAHESAKHPSFANQYAQRLKPCQGSKISAPNPASIPAASGPESP